MYFVSFLRCLCKRERGGEKKQGTNGNKEE